MDFYKVIIKDRNYSDYIITNGKEVLNINPIENKLFNNDLISIENDNIIKQSLIRSGQLIPGVLILKNSKTYGRKDGYGKLYYKMIPKDPTLPTFLVPYEIKFLGFSKVLINIYVVIIFKDWTDKHPYGLIHQVIGSVNNLEYFYEYQLYCKNLNYSIQKFKQITFTSINNLNNDIIDNDIIITQILNKYIVEDRIDWLTFTIDPEGSLDFDDAFSILKIDDKYLVSIYIAHVPIYIDYFNLWNYFTKRIATIYLPNKKLPMLPNILSDTLCSIRQNEKKICFHMDILIDNNIIEKISYGVSVIKCFKNFRYEDKELLEFKEYNELFNLCKMLPNKYIEINDSHDLVAYLMICMNNYCAKELIDRKVGIFRSAHINKPMMKPNNIPNELTNFLISSGCYKDGSIHTDLKHDFLQLNEYIHITSPIRRLVDLLNIIIFQKNILSINAFNFYLSWIDKLDFINENTKLIKKLQNECTLLDLCTNNNEVMNKIYKGYVTDKLVLNKNISYNIYLPELKLMSFIKLLSDHNIYDQLNFKLYLFTDEDNLKRKIRLHHII